MDRCSALLRYDGPARDLVARVKYRNARAAVGWLATGMAALVADAPIAVVTWAPTSPAHRRRRGFDQAELLARRVAAELDRPCRSLLARAAGPAQTGRSRADRRRGPSFTARRSLAGAAVLVVDDVITTGATMGAAATALRAAGAGSIVAVAAAHPA